MSLVTLQLSSAVNPREKEEWTMKGNIVWGVRTREDYKAGMNSLEKKQENENMRRHWIQVRGMKRR